jgi:ribosomal protein L16 Arg81 hydroxylase
MIANASQMSSETGPAMFEPIDRRSGLSLREFKHEYFNKRPVVLTDAIQGWKACTEWTFDQFKSRYGKSTILAYAYKDGRYHPSLVQRMPLGEYIDCMVAMDAESYPYYLRDNYSLFVEHRELWNEFAHPKYCYDWFRLLPAFMVRPGPRIFIGPRGAVSNLHQDMWGTHFWMAHLAGRKRWILFAPDQAQFLYPSASNHPGRVVFYDVRPDNPDLQCYPLFREAKGIDCTVQPGEIIIVPSNWAHWVVSLDPTLSLTHNYMGPGNFRTAFTGNLKWYLGTKRLRLQPIPE